MNQSLNLTDDRYGLLGVTQLPMQKSRVPFDVRLDGDVLCWSHTSTPEPAGNIDVHMFPSSNEDAQTEKGVSTFDMSENGVDVDDIGALDRFTKLRNAEDVLRFAWKYGVLNFCQHGLPATHNPRLIAKPLIGLIRSPSLWQAVEFGSEREPGFLIDERGERPWCEPSGRETIDGWLFWSRMAASIVNVAAALKRNAPTKAEDWGKIITEEIEEKQLLIDSLLARRWIATTYLEEAVNRWLHMANVRLSLHWPIGAEKAALKLEATTFGLLGVQLLTAVTGTQALAVCDGCDSPYVREGRRQQSGRANYCPACRENKVPEKIRQQRKRDKETQSKADGQR